MALLVLPTSPIVEAQLAALRRLAPEETIITEPDAVAPEQVEAILAFKVPQGLVSRFPRLLFVASAAVGVDGLLADDTIPRDLAVVRPDDPVQAARMAQYVTLAVLRWHRGLPRLEAQQRARRWERHAAQSESDWTVGLMGYGALGRHVAGTLASLGYPIRAWTRTPHREPSVDCFAGSEGLGPFLRGTRVLTCLLPLTHATRGLLGAELFAQLPRGAYVINVSRGAIVDETDLLAALAAEHLAGAALDVFAHEPLPPESPIWADGRILVTPHIAAFPQPEIVARQLLDNLARARRGEPLSNRVDRERGY